MWGCNRQKNRTYDGILEDAIPLHHRGSLRWVGLGHVLGELLSGDVIIFVETNVELEDGGWASHDCGGCQLVLPMTVLGTDLCEDATLTGVERTGEKVSMIFYVCWELVSKRDEERGSFLGSMCQCALNT